MVKGQRERRSSLVNTALSTLIGAIPCMYIAQTHTHTHTGHAALFYINPGFVQIYQTNHTDRPDRLPLELKTPTRIHSKQQQCFLMIKQYTKG